MISKTKAAADDSVWLPGWAWQAIGGGLGAIGVAALTIAGWIVSSAQDELRGQAGRLDQVSHKQVVHDVEIDHLKEFAVRAEGKLDRILELLRSPKP